jgi:hypothetical protein
VMSEPLCAWCKEPLLDQDRNGVMRDHHHECAVRAIAGSVAHIEKRCSCFVPGSIEGDPIGMTPRHAAIKAYLAFRAVQEQAGEYRDTLKV